MQKRIIASFIAFTFVFSLVVFQSSGALAQGQGGSLGQSPSGNQTFPNPLGTDNYLDVVANVVKVVLGVVGVAALVIFIYGGIVWMTSLGNSERVKQGRDTLVWASIGLVVVFASFAIVNLILSSFNRAGTT